MSLRDRLRASQVFRNLSWILSANVIVSATNFIGSILVVRYLGLADYGHIVLALAVATMLTPLVIQNSERLVLFAAADAAHPTGTILGSMGGAMALAALPCFIIFAALPWLGFGEGPALFFLIGMSLLPLPFRVIRPLMLYQGRSGINFWSDCVFAASGLILRVVLIFTGAGLAWFGGAVLVQNVVAAIVLFALYLHTRPDGDEIRFDAGLAVSSLRRSWPIMVTSFVMVIAAQVDRVALSEFGDSSAVGLLGLLAQLVLPIRIIASSATAARLPRLIAGGMSDTARFQSEAERGLALSVSVSLAVGVGVLLVLPLFSLLFAVNLGEHWHILAILILGYVIGIPGQYRVEYAMAISAERHYLWTTVLASAVGCLASVTLVWQYGLLGAALAAPVVSLLTNLVILHIDRTMIAYRPIYWRSLARGLSLEPLLSFAKPRKAG